MVLVLVKCKAGNVLYFLRQITQLHKLNTALVGKTGSDLALAEQLAVRQNVGMIDYSMLGKILVEGPDAESYLQRLCTNNVAITEGRVAYTLMLNERGGIESEITVARHSSDSFMVMSSISRTRRD